MASGELTAIPHARKTGENARIEWIDLARGIAILLVVVGHVLPGLINDHIASPSIWTCFVYNWIYAFHMPLFFALSGIFALRTGARPWPQFWKDKLQGIVYPYLVWATLQTILSIALSNVTNHASQFRDVAMVLVNPPAQFWFIYTIFLLMILHAVLLRVGIGPRLFFVLALIAHISSAFYVTGIWRMIDLVQYSAIYFAAGILFSALGGRERLPKMNSYLLTAIAGAGILTIAAAVIWNMPPDLTQRITFGILTGLVLAAMGTATVFVLAVALSHARFNQFIALCGRRSLEIYVAHTIASAGARVLLVKVLGIDTFMVHLVAGIVAGIAGPLLLVWLSERYGFSWIFSLRANSQRQAKAV